MKNKELKIRVTISKNPMPAYVRQQFEKRLYELYLQAVGKIGISDSHFYEVETKSKEEI